MTQREKAIKQAMDASREHFSQPGAGQHDRANLIRYSDLERLHDAALIAGLQRAVEVIRRDKAFRHSAPYFIKAIRTEITRLRKGAKAK